MKANWWYAMAGYKLKQFNTDFYVKYEKVQYDQHRYPDINASGAWDRSIVLAVNSLYHSSAG